MIQDLPKASFLWGVRKTSLSICPLKFCVKFSSPTGVQHWGTFYTLLTTIMQSVVGGTVVKHSPFCIAALYEIFPCRRCTWFAQNISGQQVEHKHVIFPSLPVPPRGPGCTNRRTPPGFRVCSDKPHHHTLCLLSTAVCSQHTQGRGTAGGYTLCSALQKQSENCLKHGQIVFSQITISLMNKLLTENKLALPF